MVLLTAPFIRISHAAGQDMLKTCCLLEKLRFDTGKRCVPLCRRGTPDAGTAQQKMNHRGTESTEKMLFSVLSVPRWFIF
jgi:hypothetical protein